MMRARPSPWYTGRDMATSLEQAKSFYRGALTALSFLEERHPTGRRFGQDADLRWASFRGHLMDIDRVDLLVRDADAQWPGSLGPRRVFDLEGVAEDDAFGDAALGERGGQASALDPILGAELWREDVATPAPPNLSLALSTIASLWSLPLTPLELPAIHPSTRLVAAGPSAVAALAEAFDRRPELDWADQVAVVATSPGARQLAAFCGAALNITRPAVLLAANTATEASLSGRTLLLSSDAPAEDRAWASALVA